MLFIYFISTNNYQSGKKKAWRKFRMESKSPMNHHATCSRLFRHCCCTLDSFISTSSSYSSPPSSFLSPKHSCSSYFLLLSYNYNVWLQFLHQCNINFHVRVFALLLVLAMIPVDDNSMFGRKLSKYLSLSLFLFLVLL